MELLKLILLKTSDFIQIKAAKKAAFNYIKVVLL
jgi:hypothetical protein